MVESRSRKCNEKDLILENNRREPFGFWRRRISCIFWKEGMLNQQGAHSLSEEGSKLMADAH